MKGTPQLPADGDAIYVAVTAAPDSLHLLAPDTTVSTGAAFCVDISTAQFDSLVALQFSLAWDTAVIHYTGLQGFNPALGLSFSNFGIGQVSAGFLGFVWTSGSLNGTTLPDSAVLFQVCFQAVGANGTSTPLGFSPMPLPLEAFRAPSFTEAPVSVHTGLILINSVPCNVTATASATPPAVCAGAAIHLSATGGTGYSWSGPAGFTSAIQNPQRPNATVAMSGTYTVTVTDALGCTATATAAVTVNTLPIVTAATTPPAVCAGAAINLNATGGTGYTWAGPGGFTANQQNPQIPNATATMAGTYTVTVTNAAGCTATATTVVTVNALPAVSEQHTNAHCGKSDGNITLSGTGTFTYDWADLAGASNPKDRGNLSTGTYTVTVSEPGACSTVLTILIGNVNGPSLGAIPINATCGQANGSIDLVLGNGTPPFIFVWNNGDTTEDIFGLLPGPYSVTVTDAGGCTNSTSTFIFGPAPLTATNLKEDCMGTDNQYVVSCTLTGGTPPFTLLSGAGTITGNQFVSQPVPSGANYNFSIRDTAGCPALSITGLHDCKCLTEAGTMDPKLLVTCGAAPVTAIHHQDQSLPPGTVLLFVLHQSPGASLGTPIAWNTTPTFAYSAGIVYGQTYYISAIAGPSDGMGGIDLNDPCVSVAPGTPVQFVVGYDHNVSATLCAGSSYQVGTTVFTMPGLYTVSLKTAFGCDSIIHLALDQHAPIVNLGGNQTICAQETAQLATQTVNCVGCQFAWSDPAGSTSSSISVQPAATTVYSVTITDNAGCTATSTVQVRVSQPAKTMLSENICEGGSYTVGGLSFDEAGDYEVHLLSVDGCDSTIFLKLTVVDLRNYIVRPDTFFYPPGLGVSEWTFNVVQNDQLPAGYFWKTSLSNTLQAQAGQAEVSPEGKLTYRLKNPTFRGLDSIRYELCDDECTGSCGTATVVLIIQDELVEWNDSLPNAFTPNEDGINDLFDPIQAYLDDQFVTPASRASITVLNRWGEIVYHADPYRAWDGKASSGEKVPQAAYYYMLRMDLGKTVVVKGTVHVLDAHD